MVASLLRVCSSHDELCDRSNRSHSSPTRTSSRLEGRIARRRRLHTRVSPRRVEAHLELAPSTVYRAFVRHDLGVSITSIAKVDGSSVATSGPTR